MMCPLARLALVAFALLESGQTLVLPLLVSHEFKYVTMVGNAGVTKALHGDGRESSAEMGIGAGRAFFRKLAVMGEIHTSSTINFSSDRLISANAGFIYGVRKSIWYTRVGHRDRKSTRLNSSH